MGQGIFVLINSMGFDYETAGKKEGVGLKNILIRVAYLKDKVRFSPNYHSGIKVAIKFQSH